MGVMFKFIIGIDNLMRIVTRHEAPPNQTTMSVSAVLIHIVYSLTIP